VLLTVTTTHQPATDLGYLLHKHPDRVQEFTQSFGTATVFYPEASGERCTAALMLEIDPIKLARSRRKDAPDFSLAQYVNDRSYAASSLLGVAMADVFSTARSGRCDAKQFLADSAIPVKTSRWSATSSGATVTLPTMSSPVSTATSNDHSGDSTKRAFDASTSCAAPTRSMLSNSSARSRGMTARTSTGRSTS